VLKVARTASPRNPRLGSAVSKLSGWRGAAALIGFQLLLLAASEYSD